MKIIESIEEMHKLSEAGRSVGTSVALVPTMGYLHEGHASLMREGRKRGGLLVVSIFVNPTQFGAGEDFATYPRDMERDARIAAECGVDVIFAPTASAMYPASYQSWVDVESLSLPLCGAGRPGHFRGVATVVSKLFNICRPHAAFFGMKDYQQLAIIRRMVADLNFRVEIVGMPIVREADGLAMSSRNVYLSTDERRAALSLNRSLAAARGLYRDGETDIGILRRQVESMIEAEPAAKIEYVELLDGETLEERGRANDSTLLALAVRIGRTRLIDNCLLGEE